MRVAHGLAGEGGRPASPSDLTNLSDDTPIVSNRSTSGAITAVDALPGVSLDVG
jgi:hypothetical protein